jgi:hypothetical protein
VGFVDEDMWQKIRHVAPLLLIPHANFVDFQTKAMGSDITGRMAITAVSARG